MFPRGTPFTIEHGSYYSYGHSGLLNFMADEISIVYDDDPHGTPVLLKHGESAAVKRWWDDARKRYLDAGLEAYTATWVLITGKIPVDQLNHALTHSGFRPPFLPDPTPTVDDLAYSKAKPAIQDDVVAFRADPGDSVITMSKNRDGSPPTTIRKAP